MLGLFRSGPRQSIPARLADAGPPGSAKCAVSHCQNTMTWECTYTDTTGANCGGHWCPDHLIVVDGAPFCRRHAGVASLLLTRVGTLLEMPVPRVEDRSLPLLLRMAAQLDERVVKLLQHLYSGRYDVAIAPHATIRDYREQARVVGWQAMWSASAQTGHLTVISVRTSLDEPPRVAIMRDGRVLREGIPGWILQHDNDRWNGAADTDFVDELFRSLLASLSAAGGPTP